MKAKVIKAFVDRSINKVRGVEDVFEVTNERFKDINSKSYGPFLVEVKEEVPKSNKKGEK